MSHRSAFRPKIRHTIGCSALALAIALAAPAAAQQAAGSYQGSANVTFGSANVTTGTGTTNITVSSPSAVIDWTPTDTGIANGQQINWQPANTTATFTGPNGNFAVLNRVVPVDPSRPIAFNGTTISQIFTGQAPVRGGTVFFYSPGGIVVGSTGVFDIGNLGLTTAPPVVDGNGGWYINNAVQFGQANTQSSVIINAGAQINATAQSSYVAAFAPYIQHDGTISANGQAALVAGEAGTITFSPDGLFDIQVTTGTGRVGFVQSVAGDITGPASGGAGDNHRIYMVAVPKNQLVTMSIQRGASLGFDIAGAANVQGNAVVLSAGYNITDGTPDSARAGGSGTAAIGINDNNGNFGGAGIDFTSAITASASDNLSVSIFRETRIASDAYFRSDADSIVQVFGLQNGQPGVLAVGGNLTVAGTRTDAAGAATDTGRGQFYLLNGGSATIGGTLRIESNASRDANGDGTVTAGLALARIEQASSLIVGADLIVLGQAISDGAVGAPDAQGSGNVQLIASGGSTVNVGRVTRVNANGIAGLNNGTSGQGADGRGGFSGLTVSGGSSFTTSELNVTADGVGGRDVGSGSGSGAATGGAASIQVSGANSVLTVQNPNTTGMIPLGERDLLSAEAFGGFTPFAGGTGGLAQGGSASISVSDGARLALPPQTNAFVRILARAYGGDASGDGSTGGAAQAGNVSIAVDNATLTGEDLIVSSFAQGGGDPQQIATGVVNGGNATGGTRTIGFTNGAVFTGSITGGGPSGSGGSGSPTGRGGDGSGGVALTVIESSTVNVTRSFLTFTQNTGGGGAIGGSASGGVASLQVTGGTTVNLATDARFFVGANSYANGLGGPVSATGGTATAGSASLLVDESTIQGAGNIEVAASGFAGDGPVAGGTGQGGSALVSVTNGVVDVAGLDVLADGNGSIYAPQANAVSGATGGAGAGGQAVVFLNGATLTVPSIEIGAVGTGGRIIASGTTGHTGGAATGGIASLHSSGGNSTITANDIRLEAVGEGGGIDEGSGNGGGATGGTALLQVFAGLTRIVAGSVILGADGIGGDAGGVFGETGNLGGLGTGGQSQLIVEQGGTFEIVGNVEVSGEGRGGDAIGFDIDTGEEFGIGTGGDAIGGRAYVTANGGQLSIEGDLDFDGEDEGGAGLTGGNAIAGESTLNADAGSIALTGTVSIVRSAEGGRGDIAGNALGSLTHEDADAFMIAQNGGAITVNGSTSIETTISGGDAFAGGRGGSATGGRAQAYTNAGSITFNGGVDIANQATGGEGAVGGSAAAGRAYLQSSFGGSITVNGQASVSAEADAANYFGGIATGGSAIGGEARIFSTDGGAQLSIGGGASLSANAMGGTGARDALGNGGPGGAATAGSAGVVAATGSGNVVSIAGSVNINATATGGQGLSVSGGNATGGRGLIQAGDASSVTIGGDASMIIDAYAGAVDTFADLGAPAGTRGGDAFGGQALLTLFGTGGAVSVGGELYLSPFAFGGDVNNLVGDGGNATIGLSRVFAQNGTVSLGSLDADPIAGGGYGEIGGNALPGEDTFATAVIAFNSTITIAGSTSLVVDASGGDGRNGGAGGSAVAAGSLVDADSSADGASTIRLADVFASSEARGGTGGDGGTGGIGGAATSGPVQIFGTAGNGTLIVDGFTEARSSATGGSGGFGNAGSGGAGGEGRTTLVQVGTKSGADVGPVNAGSATFADVSIDSTAVGGQGGGSETGAGGAGGNAMSGGGVLLVRGSPVTANAVFVSATGSGGNGGTGATQGAGGFGAAGGAALVASQRFERTERGTATIEVLNLLSVGAGGEGSTPGASYFAGDGGVNLIQSDVTIGTLNYVNSGILPPPAVVIDPALPIELVLSDATLEVDTLSMTTPGDFLLDLDNSTIDAATFAIAAGNFVLPATPPVQPGTITVSESLSLSTAGGDGSIRTYANFVTLGDAFYSSSQDIVLGDVETDGRFEAEAEGIITVGDLDVAGASLSAGGNVQAGNVRSSGAFSAESATGSVAIGTIDAPDVALTAATNLSAERITSASIVAEAGGTASVLGAWTAPTIQVTANDLAIPDGGSLAAGATGSIQLVSLNSAGGFIGDGLNGDAGFRISNAEFGRISGNSILVGVLDTQGNAVDLTIGNLSFAAAQLTGADGEIEFATGLGEGEPSGRIRIDGALAGSGLSDSQYLSFTTGSFELNAETGSVALAGNGPAGLGGIVYIDAANIHVASPTILGKLRDNPRYAGVADELNAAAAQQRPDGVLRALGVEFYPSDTLYIQNTGTAQNPAGFLTTLEASDIEPPGFGDGEAPDVDVIINGRFATETGEIAGADAFAAIVENAESLEGFGALSQINGCVFSANACVVQVDDDPGLAVLQSEFELLDGMRLDEEPFDLDEGSDEEEEEAEQAARAPIEPPVVLIDTRPLNPPVDIVDPVSGSGNPAALAPVPATEPAPAPAATEGDGQ